MTIHVTQPDLCQLEDFTAVLQSAWSTGILTHNGPILQALEKQISEYLGLQDYCAVTNGTLALQLAIKSLNITGTIVLPAFTWIATAAATSWENCEIRLCDIDPETFNLDLNSLSKVIDSSVEAIMPVHVFGNPCDVDAIALFAKQRNLKVIYDAAHAFGSTFNGQSVLEYGDISCTSTHATKIFNTGEGGGLISTSNILQDRFRRLRFFGYDSNKNIIDSGTNAKMTEVHAALGLANIKNVSRTIRHRKEINSTYRKALSSSKQIYFQKLHSGSNCSYFPVVFTEEDVCLRVLHMLKDNDIYARRYFYPSMSDLPFLNLKDVAPIAESISRRVLCLPCHNYITLEDILMISNLILRELREL